MGGKSSKSSKSKSTANYSYITNVELNLLNEQVTNVVNNVVNKTSQSCTATTMASQKIILSNINDAKFIDISGIDFANNVLVDFRCELIKKINNTIQQDIFSQIEAILANNVSEETLASMANEASSKVSATSFAPVNTSSESNINFKSETNINQDIKNIIQNNIQSSFTDETVQNCANNLQAEQEFIVKDIDFECDECKDREYALLNRVTCGRCGTVRIKDVKFENIVRNFGSCILGGETVNNFITSTASDIGLQLDNTKESQTTTEQINAAKTEAEGLGADLGDAARGIGEGVGTAAEGIGKGVGSIGAAWMQTLLMPLIIIGVLVVGAFIVFKMMGGISFDGKEIAGGSLNNLLTPANIGIALVVFILVIVIIALITRKNKKETFSDIKNKNVRMIVGDYDPVDIYYLSAIPSCNTDKTGYKNILGVSKYFSDTEIFNINNGYITNSSDNNILEYLENNDYIGIQTNIIEDNMNNELFLEKEENTERYLLKDKFDRYLTIDLSSDSCPHSLRLTNDKLLALHFIIQELD